MITQVDVDYNIMVMALSYSTSLMQVHAENFERFSSTKSQVCFKSMYTSIAWALNEWNWYFGDDLVNLGLIWHHFISYIQ
jgi:hypothetical protein